MTTNSETKEMYMTAKVVLVNNKEKVLLLERAGSEVEDINPSKWDLPGGRVEHGETLEDALRREIAEETGIASKDVTDVQIVRVAELEVGHENFDYFKGLRFLAHYAGGDDDVILAPEEHAGHMWCTFDEALEKLSPDDDFTKEKHEAVAAARDAYRAAHASEQALRTLAEFDNYKKRAEEEKKNFTKYASEKVIMEMLPVLDNFHAATGFVPEEQKDSSWLQGIMFIQQQMEKVFEDAGVSAIAISEGDAFDPTTMEAVKAQDAEDKEDQAAETQSVAKVIQKGYRIGGDRVLRPARVEVV